MQSLAKKYIVANAPYILLNANNADRNFAQMAENVVAKLASEGILDTDKASIAELLRFYVKFADEICAKEIRSQEKNGCEANDLKQFLQPKTFSFDIGSNLDYFQIVDSDGHPTSKVFRRKIVALKNLGATSNNYDSLINFKTLKKMEQAIFCPEYKMLCFFSQ